MRALVSILGGCVWLTACAEWPSEAKAPPRAQACTGYAHQGCPDWVGTPADVADASEQSTDPPDSERGLRSSVVASVVAAYGEGEIAEVPRPAPSTADAALLAVAASVDPSRLLTESITPMRDPARTECTVVGKAGVCVPRQPGPVVVTDVVALASCPAELFVGAADVNGSLRWAIPATAAGSHGGHFFVRGDEHLTVAARGAAVTQPGDVRCVVTWAGFRPRMVPLMAGTNAATLAP